MQSIVDFFIANFGELRFALMVLAMHTVPNFRVGSVIS
jgi:hypothetical protein